MTICSPQLGLSPQSQLGGEVHDREMLKALASLGVDIEIILPFGKKHPNHKRLHFYFLPLPFVYPPIIFNFLILPYLFVIYHRRPFSVLRVHSPLFVGIGALIFRLFHPQVKLLATWHHQDPDWITKQADKLLLSRFDGIVTDSPATVSQLLQTYGLRKKTIAITNGVDSKYRPLPKDKILVDKYGLKDKDVLLFLGHLIPRKNVSFLLEVLKLLPERVVLLVAGEGPEKNNLIAKVRDFGLSKRVIFTGFVSEEEKVSYYNLADIFLSSSALEGFGLTTAEAMSCGLPAIISNFATAKDLVTQGKSGYILDNSQNAWAKIIKDLLNNEIKLKHMKAYARQEAINKFSWKCAAEKYYQLLRIL